MIDLHPVVQFFLIGLPTAMIMGIVMVTPVAIMFSFMVAKDATDTPQQDMFNTRWQLMKIYMKRMRSWDNIKAEFKSNNAIHNRR